MKNTFFFKDRLYLPESSFGNIVAIVLFILFYHLFLLRVKPSTEQLDAETLYPDY